MIHRRKTPQIIIDFAIGICYSKNRRSPDSHSIFAVASEDPKKRRLCQAQPLCGFYGEKETILQYFMEKAKNPFNGHAYRILCAPLGNGFYSKAPVCAMTSPS